MIGNPGEDQSASTRADTRNPSWKEGHDAAGAAARGGPGSPPYERAFGTPHGVSAGRPPPPPRPLPRGGAQKPNPPRPPPPPPPDRPHPPRAAAPARAVARPRSPPPARPAARSLA